MNTAQKILRGLAHDYGIDPNPLYCWEAWRISRESGEPLPEFAAQYFDQVAANLVTMENPETGKHDAAVAHAVGFKTPGRGNHWTQAQDYGAWDGKGGVDRVRLFAEVQAAKADGTPIDEAFRSVADGFHTSESTVRRVYYAMKNKMPQFP